MGLWWYFFAVIFDHFRSFFLFVFHIQPLLLLLPVSLRLSHKPIALLAIASLLVTLFKVQFVGSPFPGNLTLWSALQLSG